MTRPEISANDKIHMSLEYLFAEEELVKGNVQSDLGRLMLHDTDLRTIQPAFPVTVRRHLLMETLVDQIDQRDKRSSKFAQRLWGLVQRFTESADRIETSDPFDYEYQRKDAYDSASDSQISVRSISYDGSIVVNDQEFKFVPDRRLVAVSAFHLPKAGYGYHGSTFTLAPGDTSPSVIYDGSPENLPHVDPLKSPTANMLQIIATAASLKGV